VTVTGDINLLMNAMYDLVRSPLGNDENDCEDSKAKLEKFCASLFLGDSTNAPLRCRAGAQSADSPEYVEPVRARIIIGMRMTSAWKLPVNLLRPRAVANDPKPITALIPLIAMTAVQALCSKIKSRQVKLTAHIRGPAVMISAEAGSSEILLM